jgi:hypothetical protein
VASELVMTLVTALTAKGAEALVASGKNQLATLFRAVQERFRREGPGQAAILRAAIENPDDQERRQKLAEVLGRLLAEDPAFRAQLARYWQHASTDSAGTRAVVINHFGGSAAKVVQARDIYGDVTF